MIKTSFKESVKKMDFWDVLGWISVLVLLLWALGKSFGIIHSPVWVEMVPALTGVGAVAVMLVKFGEYKNILITLNHEFKEMKQDITDLKQDMGLVKHDVKRIYTSASCMKGKCKADYV